MKPIVSVLLALALFAGIMTFGAKGASERVAQSETTAAVSDARETAAVASRAEPTAADPAPETSVPSTQGACAAAREESLPITEEDVSRLWQMAYFLDYTTDYDCERDDGERFICSGFFGEAIFELCACYGVATDSEPYAEHTADPLGLMPYSESTEGDRYWYWSRIDADAVDYIVRNVFNTYLPTPGDPTDTIMQGYYYLGGYYYLNTGMGGIECNPQIASCTLGENGRYNVQLDWCDCDMDGGAESEVLASICVEASLHMVDGQRMWTIYRIRTLTDDPCQSMG